MSSPENPPAYNTTQDAVAYPVQPASYMGPGPSQQHPPTIIYQTQRKEKKVWADYKAKASTGLGWTQIVVAILAIAFNTAACLVQSDREYYDRNYAPNTAGGFYGALFFFLSGGFALGASKHKTSCKIYSTMVLAILSATFGCGMLATGALIIVEEQDDATTLAMGALLVLLSILGIAAAIASAVICCKVVCCGRKNRPRETYEPNTAVTQQLPIAHQPGQPPTFITITTTQHIPMGELSAQVLSPAPPGQHAHIHGQQVIIGGQSYAIPGLQNTALVPEAVIPGLQNTALVPEAEKAM